MGKSLTEKRAQETARVRHEYRARKKEELKIADNLEFKDELLRIGRRDNDQEPGPPVLDE